jgi:Tfp pilus assembly protein PilN
VSAPLNLARRPFRNERLPSLILAASCLALVLLTARHALVARDLLPGRARDVESQVVVLEKEIAALRAESSELLRLEAAPKALKEWAAIAELVDRRAFSWTGLLAALEGALPAGVKLVSISPQTKAGRTELSLTAMGRRAEDALALLQSLQAHEAFEGAFLNGWTEGKDGIDISCTVRYAPKRHPLRKADQRPGASPLRKADQLPGAGR